MCRHYQVDGNGTNTVGFIIFKEKCALPNDISYGAYSVGYDISYGTYSVGYDMSYSTYSVGYDMSYSTYSVGYDMSYSTYIPCYVFMKP